MSMWDLLNLLKIFLPHTHTSISGSSKGLALSLSCFTLYDITSWNPQNIWRYEKYHFHFHKMHILESSMIWYENTSENAQVEKKNAACGFLHLFRQQIRNTFEITHRRKTNQWSQCAFAPFKKGIFWDSGENSNKCNHCNFESFQASALRRHL